MQLSAGDSPILPRSERPGTTASWNRRSLLAGAAVVVLTAVVLLAMGRISWCACGYVKLWHAGAADPQTSQHLTDPYSFSHVIHGFGFFWLLWLVARHLSVGARGVIAIAAECGWELLENTPLIIDRYRENTASLEYYGDSVVNSLGDIAAMVLGFWLASRLPFWVVVAITVAIELVLLVLIRDNLVLNVLMLIWPIDAIRRWQLGG